MREKKTYSSRYVACSEAMFETGGAGVNWRNPSKTCRTLRGSAMPIGMGSDAFLKISGVFVASRHDPNCQNSQFIIRVIPSATISCLANRWCRSRWVAARLFVAGVLSSFQSFILKPGVGVLDLLNLPMIGREFITILVVVDPIGTLPVFYFATAGLHKSVHRAVAVRAVLIATLVLLAFLVGGQALLETLGLRFGSFQIAGGIILFLFAMTMVLGEAKSDQEIKEASRDGLHGAVFPLAMPSIASPGAMLAIVVLTDNHKHSVAEQVVTGGVLLVVMGITLVLLLLAARLKPVLGASGANIISRLMGILLATIAVDAILGGFEAVGMLDLARGGVLGAGGV